MEKSWVTMEQKICLVCDKQYDTGNLLMASDRSGKNILLKDQFDKYTVNGYGLCPEHDKDGYCTCIEINNAPYTDRDNPVRVRPENAYRTGNFCFIKKEAFGSLLNVPFSKIVYIDPEAFMAITSMVSQ